MHADDALGARFRAQDAERVAVEGDGDDLRAAGSSIHARPFEHRPMSCVHAVELADGDHRRTEAVRNLGGIVEDDHRSAADSAGSAGASAAIGGCVASHQMPQNGSSSGTKR